MPHKDPEKHKEYQRQYREQNRKKIQEYRQTPEYIRSNRIKHWKNRGVVCDNFDALYDHYTSTSFCNACRVELTIDKKRSSTTKCLDHCHNTGLFRNILCHSCNIKRRENNIL